MTKALKYLGALMSHLQPWQADGTVHTVGCIPAADGNAHQQHCQGYRAGKRAKDCTYRSTDNLSQVTAEPFVSQNKLGLLQNRVAAPYTPPICEGFNSQGQQAEPVGQAQRGRSALHGFHKQC